MKIWISQQQMIGFSSNFKHKLMGPSHSQKRFQWRQHSNEDDLLMKTTSNGSWPQNMGNWISQQSLIGSSSNKLIGPKLKNVSMKTTFNGRWPLMGDDLKIWKFEYLSSHWLDLPQIWNISSKDQTKVKKGLNEDDLQWKTTSDGRWPQNMKIWIHQQALIGSSSNFKHKLIGPYQSQIRFQWRWPSMEDDL